MKYTVTILLFFWIAAGISQTPDSDAVFEKIVKEYTLQKDGSTEFHFYKRLKLLTHYSFNRLYGETFIVYDPTHQELQINFCKTTHQDGKVTEAPFNAYNEVLPHFASHAPYYNYLREMVVTHPGTEVNAVLELDYTLKTQAGYFPGLMAHEILTETSPVQDEEIIIRIPKGKSLHYKVMNLRTAPEITEEGAYEIYRFTFRGIREASHESHQPEYDTHLPGLMFSTVTWQEALNGIFKLPLWDYKINEQMQSTVDNIREENKYDLSFILKLNEMFADNINNYPIPWNYTGYTARKPIDTWKSNGGTPLEKSLLFTAMLRSSNVNALPVLVIPAAYYNPDIGCLPLVSQFLVQVNPRELEQMYLSATDVASQNMVFRLDGSTLITLDPKQSRTEFINEKFENKVVTSGTLIFDDSLHVSGNIEMMFSEATNPYYTIQRDSAAVKTFINGIANKEIKSYKVINSAQYRSLADIVFEIPKAPEKLAQYYFYELPENKEGTDDWHINYLLPDRIDPFEIPNRLDEEYSYEITLPANATLVNPVELTEMRTGFGEVILSTSQEGNKVTVKRMFVITEKEIPVDQYNDLKRLIDLWNEKNFRTLIWKMD